ncbi:hypothetical protein WG66_006448 [Moniliophthora roreri]|nr:hypothetical protein WG66_006448 [Moniliophthora roreri]
MRNNREITTALQALATLTLGNFDSLIVPSSRSGFRIPKLCPCSYCVGATVDVPGEAFDGKTLKGVGVGE